MSKPASTKVKKPRTFVTMAVKMELALDEQTQGYLDGQSRIACWLANHLLALAKQIRRKVTKDNKQGREVDMKDIYFLYGRHNLRNYMVGLKETKPFLKLVYSSVLKNTALRVSRSIRDTRHSDFSGHQNRLGWPKFYKWGQDWFSLEYETQKGFRLIPRAIILSLGKKLDDQDKPHQLHLTLPLREARPDFANSKSVKALRIVKEHGKYFAILTVNRPIVIQKPLPVNPKIIAFDPGHKNPLTGFDDEGQTIKIEPPKWLQVIDQQIDETRSRRDHCKRRSIRIMTPSSTLEFNQDSKTQKKYYWQASRKWRYYDTKLKRLQAQRQEQIKTWAFTVVNYFYKHYDLVAMGNYSPYGQGETKNLRRLFNNQSLIGALRHAFAWMAARSGKRFETFDEYNTTKTCSHCGFILPEKLDLDTRIWTCPNPICNQINDRDGNAACNGFRKILATNPELNQDNLSRSDQLKALTPSLALSRTYRLTGAGTFKVVPEPELRSLPSVVF